MPELYSFSINDDALLALLYLPFFRKPNQLCPFVGLQQQEVALSHDPEPGFEELEILGLWDSDAKELTQLGRQLFVPLMSPNARIMLFRGATAKTPIQEFYVYNKYITQYVETPGLREVRGPYDEPQIVNHLRTIFQDRRSPRTDNRLSLLEQEFVSLAILRKIQQENPNADAAAMVQYCQQSMAEEDFGLPILGHLMPPEQGGPPTDEESFAQILAQLQGDGLATAEGKSWRMEPTLAELLDRLLGGGDIYMIREEFDDEELLVREVSVFPGDAGYFMGRSSFSPAVAQRVVHMEDMEWHVLYRVINEIGRHKDYLANLTLEVKRRTQAHLRG